MLSLFVADSRFVAARGQDPGPRRLVVAVQCQHVSLLPQGVRRDRERQLDLFPSQEDYAENLDAINEKPIDLRTCDLLINPK